MITIDMDIRREVNVEYYLKVLASLAHHDDGRVDDLERRFIQIQAELLGVDVEPYFASAWDWDELGQQAVQISRKTALWIVRDGIALGYINGELSREQRQSLYSLAGRLGLTSADVDAVESWLRDYWALLERGNRLLQG